MEAFVQIEYADYGDATYFELVDLDLTALAMRAGLLLSLLTTADGGAASPHPHRSSAFFDSVPVSIG